MDELKIQKQLRKFCAEREWQKFHTLKNIAAALSVEASELLEIFQWMDEEPDLTSNKEIKEKISNVPMKVRKSLCFSNRCTSMIKQTIIVQ